MFVSTATTTATAAVPHPKRQASSSPPYLFFQRNTPTFRIRIPADLQPCLGKTEYRRSIGRCYAPEAKLRALKLATAALEVFSFVREALQARELLTHSHETGKGDTRKNDAEYTHSQRYRERYQVAQENSTNDSGYTSDLKGRTLASLTDDEIQSIAENALLNALRGERLISIRAVRDQVLYGENIAAYEKLKPIMAERQRSEDAATAHTAGQTAADYADREAQCRQELQRGILSEDTARITDTIFAGSGIQMNPETESYTALEAFPPTASIPYIMACQKMLEANVSYYSTMKEHTKGNEGIRNAEIERLEARQEARREKRRIKIANETAAAATAAVIQPPVAQASPQAQRQQKTLKETIEEFADDRIREGQWNAASRTRAMSKYDLFRAIVDPDDTLPVGALNAALLTRYRKTLFGYPVNRTKKVAYRDMPLPQVLADAEAGRIPVEDRMGVQTVINHCQTVIAFMTWAGRREYIANTAISGLLIVSKKAQAGDEETRDPFTSEDIRKLFNPEHYLRAGLWRREGNAVGASPSRFWVPLLGLFTGARLEELAQLHLEDIVLVDETRSVRRMFPTGGEQQSKRPDEVVCIHIHRNSPSHHLKNAASQRHAPLSSVLIDDFGFLDYAAIVSSRAVPGDSRLFPELRRSTATDKLSSKLSNWFTTYRRRVDVGTGEEEGKKVFHCFRNTISFWMDRQETIQEKAAARTLGHAVNGITFKTYSKDTSPHIISRTVTEPFSEYVRPLLDIEGLKASPFTQCGGGDEREEMRGNDGL